MPWMTDPQTERPPTTEPEREHLVYVDDRGEPDECTEDCPGCHWEGNADCEAIRGGCAICDPDGKLYEAQALARADHGITS